MVDMACKERGGGLIAAAPLACSTGREAESLQTMQSVKPCRRYPPEVHPVYTIGGDVSSRRADAARSRAHTVAGATVPNSEFRERVAQLMRRLGRKQLPDRRLSSRKAF